MSKERVEYGTCDQCGKAGQVYKEGCEHCNPPLDGDLGSEPPAVVVNKGDQI